jgi:hypothetical protein
LKEQLTLYPQPPPHHKDGLQIHILSTWSSDFDLLRKWRMLRQKVKFKCKTHVQWVFSIVERLWVRLTSQSKKVLKRQN